jgi:hypothetical protein
MEGPPQTIQSNYPRQIETQDVKKLRLLLDAYFGIYWIVASTIAAYFLLPFVVGLILAAMRYDVERSMDSVYVIDFIAMVVANGFISFREASKVAEAKGKAAWYAVLLTFGSVLLSPCCAGLGGCVVIQQACSNEFVRYGIRTRAFGVRKADVEAKIRQLSTPQPPASPDAPPAQSA